MQQWNRFKGFPTASSSISMSDSQTTFTNWMKHHQNYSGSWVVHELCNHGNQSLWLHKLAQFVTNFSSELCLYLFLVIITRQRSLWAHRNQRQPIFFLYNYFHTNSIPFSDCHHSLSRLGAKVVTTFSIRWLSGLIVSWNGSRESHIKHFLSSCN